MVNPLDLDSPGRAGAIRDLVAQVDQLKRQLAEVRSTALTGQAMPAPYVHPDPVIGWMARGLSGNVPVPNGVPTLVQWPAAGGEAGTAVTHPTPADLAAGVDGIYAVSAWVHFVAGGQPVEAREMRIVRNGIAVAYASLTTAAAVTLQLSRSIRLTAGDMIAVEVQQASGAPLDLYGVPTFAGFTMALIQEVT